MSRHPELEAEQAYMDHAYACLEDTRRAATKMTSLVEVGQGGTNQARYERDVIWDTLAHRLSQLELGEAALLFGRLDFADDLTDDGVAGTVAENRGATYYVGRVAVADQHQDPVVVDWRAPVAEAFYRATGREPMGLARRRHFATRGRTLLGMEDELFGAAVTALDLEARAGADDAIRGHGALIAALETNRTGKLGDIVATIQGEQDEVIRAELPGVLVVQGGPGTGKTVVALHRAAYLLYTHRFPLEGQGVLVIGPNRLFLGYIDQVLPSLGEAGVELAVLADLLPDDVRVSGYDTGVAARIKGDLVMRRVLARAVRDRQQGLRDDLVVGYGTQYLRVTVEQSRRIVAEARRRFRRHNAGRRHVESELYAALARSGHGDLAPHEVRERLRGTLPLREALEWMWPVLTPAELLHDLFSSPGLLRHAARELLGEAEWRSLRRPRHESADEVVWTHDDAPLLDEARDLLGPRPRSRRQRQLDAAAGVVDDGEVRTYGHIVVDEAQDLSPMQLRMLERRSLNGSMTIVGDIAQSTGQWAHADWDEILEHLPERRPPRRVELSVGYRLPAPIMDVAGRLLAEAAPGLEPPTSVRDDGDPPRFLPADDEASAPSLGAAVVAAVRDELDAVSPGNVAVICPWSLVDEVGDALEAAGIEHGHANRHGLDQQVTVVPVSLAKGLELDASVVVEPAAIVDEEAQGVRALYVALTRATKRLAVVHGRPLPAALVPAAQLV